MEPEYPPYPSFWQRNRKPLLTMAVTPVLTTILATTWSVRGGFIVGLVFLAACLLWFTSTCDDIAWMTKSMAAVSYLGTAAVVLGLLFTAFAIGMHDVHAALLAVKGSLLGVLVTGIFLFRAFRQASPDEEDQPQGPPVEPLD